jgi:hypothetical protein
MGWRKMLSHSIGGDIALGNWRATYNKKEDSIDILHPSDGIPYIKSDTTFSGALFYLEIVGGKLQLVQYPGWPDTVAQDENYMLDGDMAWDDTVATGDILIDYLLGSATAMMHYDGELGDAEFISDTIDLQKVGKYHSSEAEWVATKPAGTDIAIYSSASVNGGDWGAWTAIAASGNFIGCLPAADSDLTLYDLRYKIVLTPTVDLLTTPDMSSLTTTINSQKHFRVMSDGAYKESPHIIASVLGATTETLE